MVAQFASPLTYERARIIRSGLRRDGGGEGLRFAGLLASCVSIVVGGAGFLLSAHWAYQVINPGPHLPMLSVSQALFPYLLLGIGETLGMVVALHYFRRAHIAWAIGMLVVAVAVAVWIAGSILLVTATMPFTYPVPIVLLGMWLGIILISVFHKNGVS